MFVRTVNQNNSNGVQEFCENKMQKFCAKASKITEKVSLSAQEIIRQDQHAHSLPSSSMSSTQVVHHHHHDSYWPWFFYGRQPTTTINNYNGATPADSAFCATTDSSSTTEKDKKKNNDAVALAIVVALGAVAVVVGGIGTYCLGKVNAGLEKIDSEITKLGKLEKQSGKLKKLQKEAELPRAAKEITKQVGKIVDLNREICERVKSSLNWDFYNDVSMMAGAGLACAGSALMYANSPGDLVNDVLVGVLPGAAIFTASMISKLYKAGYDNVDAQNLETAREILVEQKSIETKIELLKY
jgi:hypothetical protein